MIHPSGPDWCILRIPTCMPHVIAFTHCQHRAFPDALGITRLNEKLASCGKRNGQHLEPQGDRQDRFARQMNMSWSRPGTGRTALVIFPIAPEVIRAVKIPDALSRSAGSCFRIRIRALAVFRPVAGPASADHEVAEVGAVYTARGDSALIREADTLPVYLDCVAVNNGRDTGNPV